MSRAAPFVILVVAALGLDCGAGYGGICYSSADCTSRLVCNGDHPLRVGCRSDDDCRSTDRTVARCARRTLNGVTHEGVCVHPGQCVPPEQTIP